MSAPLSMAETAAEVGLCYDVFRKRWRAMAAERGFPRPFAGRKWDRDAVALWKLKKSQGDVDHGRAAEFRRDPQAHAKAVAELMQLRAA